MDQFKQFLSRWSQPAIIFTLLSAIVYSTIWLVKLDDRIVAQAVVASAMSVEMDVLKNKVRLMELTQSRIGAVLDSQINKVRGLDSRMTRNESWITSNSNHEHQRGE